MVHCAALGQHGRGHDRQRRAAGVAAGNRASRIMRRLSTCTDSQAAPASASRTCSLRGAPAARVTSAPRASRTSVVGVRSTPSRADQLEVVLGVDLDVRDAGDHRGDVGQGAAGGAAGRAEGGGELQQRGALPQLEVEAGAGGEVDEGRGRVARGRVERPGAEPRDLASVCLRHRDRALAGARSSTGVGGGGCRGSGRPWRRGRGRRPARRGRRRSAPRLQRSWTVQPRSRRISSSSASTRAIPARLSPSASSSRIRCRVSMSSWL